MFEDFGWKKSGDLPNYRGRGWAYIARGEWKKGGEGKKNCTKVWAKVLLNILKKVPVSFFFLFLGGRGGGGEWVPNEQMIIDHQ